MSEKNFMVAGTEIESYVDKMDQCVNKIANLLGEACVSRARSGKNTGNVGNDITNLIKNLSQEDRIKVLTKLAVILTTQLTNGIDDRSSKKESKSRSDIFAFRDRY